MARARCSVVAATVALFLVQAQDASALVWGIRSTATNSPPAYSAPPVELFRINEDGTGYVDHGTIVNISPGVGRATNFDGLAYSSRFGLMAFEVFGAGTTSRLATIDPDGNGTYAVTATKVDLALSGREIRGAAFDEKGRLWALDTIGDVLLQVDPLTGGMIGTPQGLTLSGSPYAFEGNTVDLAVTPEGKAYMTAVAASDARVYTLDINTGVLAEIRQDSNWLGEVGATFSVHTGPSKLYALDVSGPEDFVRYDLPPAGAIPRSVEFTLPGTLNAGRGDLAANIQEFPYLRHDGDVDPYVAEGWSRRIAGSGITVGPVPGERAWCVDDQSSAGSNGFGYYKHLSAEQWDLAMRVGWSLAMEVRVEDYQPFSFGGASSGQVAIPGPYDKIFSLSFTTDGDGDPIAGLYAGGGNWLQTPVIEGDGYHLYELVFNPARQMADLYVDGDLMLADFAGMTHTQDINRVLFGANSSADTGTGYYRMVRFQIVPEPATLSILGLGALALLRRRRRGTRG